MRKAKPCRVIDADGHVYEPAAVWEEYLAPEYRVAARTAFSHEVDAEGNAVTIVNGRIVPEMSCSKINRQAIWRPGMTPEQIGALDPNVAHPINPGASDPAARLRDMDAMGIDVAVVFPTLFAEYFPVVENPDCARALARAYNDWVLDYARADATRIVPAAVLPLQALPFALAELERVAERGFRAVFLRPSFVRGRFLNHPEFDPLWRKLETLGVAACVHPSPGSTNPEWTSEGSFIDRVAASLGVGHYVAEAVAPQMDNSIFVTAAAFYGHMEQYPRLKLALLHSGASWLPIALEKSETYLWLSFQAIPVSLEPEHVFFSRPSLISFDPWETSVANLSDVFAGVGAFCSRYPQHDASDAFASLEMLNRSAVPLPVIEALMGGNAARFFSI
jgi:predicted TIM-barrel fold metal-dependent hydrolase